jgi:hypothetical protein
VKRIACSVLASVVILLFVPTLASAQASSYQVGGPNQQIAHDAFISGCYATFTDHQDSTPAASVLVSGPPWELYPSITDDSYGTGSASASTQIGQASAEGVSFTASDSAGTSLPTNPNTCGVYGGASQGGTFYSFTLTQPSTVDFDVSLSHSFSGRGQYGTRGGVTAVLQLRAGSNAGAIMPGFELYTNITTTDVSVPSVHASANLPAGDYFIVGDLGVAADQGESASASLSVNLNIGPAPEVVGQVTQVDGTPTITSPGGTPQPVAAGTPIHMGDVLSAGTGSNMHVTLNDNTTFAVAAGSLTVDNYVYDPNAPEPQGTGFGSGVFNAFHTLAVYTSGLLDKQAVHNVNVETEFDGIGIRGTEFILDGTSGTQEVLYLDQGEVSITPHDGTLAPPDFQPQIFDAPVVITFNQTSITTSPLDQTTYDRLKSQIEGPSTADTTPPTISCGAAPTGWQNSNVSIACTASDSGSGLANAADASFSLPTSVASGTETANASTSSHQVCDIANNCATAGPISGIMIDMKAPSITINTPTSNGSFVLNSAVASSYTCADGGSGVASCAGPVASGTNLITSSVGSQTFTVNAKDNVGNPSSASASYTVSYGICQLYDSTKAAKSGSTIPLKLDLCDANGNDVSNPAIVVHAASMVQVSTNASTAIEDAGNSNPDSDFRFDSTLGTAGGYIFNLQTSGLAIGTYTLSFTAGTDPVPHSISFQVH